ncbi:nuclease [Armatimonadota bacterium]|nr:nuclease [Armatimonadota bacterium]
MSLRRILFLGSLLIALSSLSLPSFAWHAAGHEATAWVAYKALGQAQTHTIADMLRKHPDYALWMQEKPSEMEEDLYLFLRAAIWPDDIRAPKHPSHHFAHSSWHYVNRLFIIDGQASPKLEKGKHILEAIALNSKTLQSTSPDADKAVALCWIFHLMGDIHQPLHSTALVSAQFPEGDRGGNLFFVRNKTRTNNLHSLWDGLWDKETAGKSVSDSGVRERVDHVKLLKVVGRVLKQYPANGFKELGNTDYSSWVDESFALAKRAVYLDGKLPIGTDTHTPGQLPDTYEADARKLGERQLALGGYRLAAQLKSLLKL